MPLTILLPNGTKKSSRQGSAILCHRDGADNRHETRPSVGQQMMEANRAYQVMAPLYVFAEEHPEEARRHSSTGPGDLTLLSCCGQHQLPVPLRAEFAFVFASALVFMSRHCTTVYCDQRTSSSRGHSPPPSQSHSVRLQIICIANHLIICITRIEHVNQ